MPTIGITIGDPSGIGPEIVCKALASMSPEQQSTVLVIGSQDVIARANALTHSKLSFSQKGLDKAVRVANVDSPQASSIQDGTVSKGGGHAAYTYVAHAVELAMSGTIDAIVTAPLNKAAMHLAGYSFDGHTGLLQHLTKSDSSFMLFASSKLTTILTTTHVSLAQAIKACKSDNIFQTIRAGHQHLLKLGQENPKIAVSALNPHAGEQGIFGREELDEIIPGIEQARQQGIDIHGPFPGDTIFHRALTGEFDLVVAQYHDQGLIPMKLADFDNAVNVTLGLPIIRTSVDHGTAFDIAWKGVARHTNMISAINYARVLVAAHNQ